METTISHQVLKDEIEAGKCKGVVVQVPDTIIDLISEYQKAFKRLHPSRSKPTRPNVVVLIISKGVTGIQSAIQELNQQAAELANQ